MEPSFLVTLLKKIPVFGAFQQRLLLADAQVAEFKRRYEQSEAERERDRLEHEKTEQAFQRLTELHTEEVRVVGGTEFRRGIRTGGLWSPFCPRCHCPAVFHPPQDMMACSDEDCRWVSQIHGYELPSTISRLP